MYILLVYIRAYDTVIKECYTSTTLVAILLIYLNAILEKNC